MNSAIIVRIKKFGKKQDILTKKQYSKEDEYGWKTECWTETYPYGGCGFKRGGMAMVSIYTIRKDNNNWRRSGRRKDNSGSQISGSS